TSKNSASAEIKRLRATLQQTEAQMAQYKSEAERAMREKIAKMPNETLRAAIVEHDIRRVSAEANKAKYEKDIAAARAKLEALGVRDPQQEMLLHNIENETEITNN